MNLYVRFALIDLFGLIDTFFDSENDASGIHSAFLIVESQVVLIQIWTKHVKVILIVLPKIQELISISIITKIWPGAFFDAFVLLCNLWFACATMPVVLFLTKTQSNIAVELLPILSG